MDFSQFEARKREHIVHALDSAHQASGLSGLNKVRLVHHALPELSFSEVELKTKCLKQELATPFFIAGMTAGHPQAPEINRRLAVACERRGWAMGVGSQRRELSLEGNSIPVDGWQKLRERVPRLTLFANLGISQLIGMKFEMVYGLVERLGAQALVIHANPLQEVLQPEGTPQFKGGLRILGELCENSPVPVVLKETGCGFSEPVLKQLSHLGLAAVDVSGLGGTHWGRIEGARASADSVFARAAQTFAEWGVPTVESVKAAAQILSSPSEGQSGTEIWASGGVRTGLDAAKLIALGAHRVGYAQPALEAALKSEQALDEWMQLQEFELRVALFCTASQRCSDLRLNLEKYRE